MKTTLAIFDCYLRQGPSLGADEIAAMTGSSGEGIMERLCILERRGYVSELSGKYVLAGKLAELAGGTGMNIKGSEDAGGAPELLLCEIPMAGAILDRRGTVEFCNRRLLEMTGRLGHEVAGRCWFETFVPEDSRNRRRSEYHLAMSSGRVRERYRSEVLSSDGRRLELSWHCAVIRDAQGNARRLVKLGLETGAAPDLETARYAMIGRAAAGLVHDLNNLLLPVINYSEMIMGRTASDNELQEWARQISLAGRRGKLLAARMLSAVRGGNAPLNLDRMDLGAAAVEFCELAKGMLGRNISLEIDPGFGGAFISGDRDMLDQLMMNLALNARDAMPEGGRICIGISNEKTGDAVSCHGSELLPGKYVLLSFSDSGQGMGVDVLGRIFDPFFTTKDKGSGIGLANVLEIVKKHKAHVKVESRIGLGTTFRVYFPVPEQ